MAQRIQVIIGNEYVGSLQSLNVRVRPSRGYLSDGEIIVHPVNVCTVEPLWSTIVAGTLNTYQ